MSVEPQDLPGSTHESLQDRSWARRILPHLLVSPTPASPSKATTSNVKGSPRPPTHGVAPRGAGVVGRAEVPVQHITVDRHADQRIDNFLMRELKHVPRTRIYRMIRRGEVRVNGSRVSPHRRLVAGDSVRIPPTRGGAGGGKVPVPQPLIAAMADRIVFEDADLLVVDKPSGLAVHGGSGVPYGLVDALRELRDDSLDLVHRIDKDTSGCVMLAKSRDTLNRLHQAFRNHAIDKRYTAIVHGVVDVDTLTLSEPLVRYRTTSGERRVRVDVGGQVASTTVTVVNRCPVASHLSVEPLTGRTHQIRAHLQSAGHPIIGDQKYRGDSPEVNCKRLMLHASSIVVSGWFEAHASLPVEFGRLWKELTQGIETKTPEDLA